MTENRIIVGIRPQVVIIRRAKVRRYRKYLRMITSDPAEPINVNIMFVTSGNALQFWSAFSLKKRLTSGGRFCSNFIPGHNSNTWAAYWTLQNHKWPGKNRSRLAPSDLSWWECHARGCPSGVTSQYNRPRHYPNHSQCDLIRPVWYCSFGVARFERRWPTRHSTKRKTCHKCRTQLAIRILVWWAL